MKIVLEKAEMNYLSALFKLLAAGQKEPEAAAFYGSLADKVSPNRLYCNLNREEAKLLLDIIEAAKVNLLKVTANGKSPVGSILRADVLEKVLNGAALKLATKLEGAENGI